MSCLGNILWMAFAGIWLGLSWFLLGLMWCCTIIGIPVGRQCFKLAGLSLAPFGREVSFQGGMGSGVLNFFWLTFGGIELAALAFVWGLLLCITIIGIPFGSQCFKIAKLALMPFRSEVF